MYKKEKERIKYTGNRENIIFNELSNPLKETKLSSKVNIDNYSQEIIRPYYDRDYFEVISEVNNLNNIVPQKLPVYNFVTEEINGERRYAPDGKLIFIREYDSDVIRDYHVKVSDKTKIDKIFEYDKSTGELRTKIESVTRDSSIIKSNITIFDKKINKKYIMLQLTQDGRVNNITEFSDSGKNFRTVYRDDESIQAIKYISGKETQTDGFVMTDCVLDKDGKISKIKIFSESKDTIISYVDNKKTISIRKKV